jgi:hypothetical protein
MDDSDYAESDVEYDDYSDQPMSEDDDAGDDYGFDPGADQVTCSQKVLIVILVVPWLWLGS